MGTDLQHLLDKIQSEGIDKAKAESDALLADARAEARQIIATAKQEADVSRAKAKQDADAFQQRAAEVIRQAGRDVTLNVEQAVQRMMEALLLKETRAVMALPEILTQLTKEVVQNYLAAGETHISVHLPKTAEALLPALREKLCAGSAQGKVEVVLDAAQGTGFSVRTQNGRVEHDFSAEAIADAMSKTLRPQLAALLKTEG